MPTIVFDVLVDGRTDVVDVGVSMDNVALTKRLDGVPLAVDPGEHTFELTVPGRATVRRRLVIREGVKARHERVVIGEAAPPSAPAPVDRASSDGMPPRRVAALVTGGFGVLGLAGGTYLGLLAKSTYDEASSTTRCPSGPTSCDAEGVEGGRDAHAQALASTVAFAASGALLAGAALLWFSTPNVKVRAAATHIVLTGAW